jgi:hypothetical protein
MIRFLTLRWSVTFPTVMNAVSTALDGMVLPRKMVKIISIVGIFQSVIGRLKYCAGRQAHGMSLGRVKRLDD